ncbi:hypothetical protein JTE90_008738 [Oedothorax gibbosus]|uniref:Uncharacterized protein n=1 Tax=Oedothorax gibbosus TaxID=931172 RepID=A0AAV6UP30_9ARAC|nr:hypothetical protein JTE90_008738 [Oedothorax gibbosus]
MNQKAADTGKGIIDLAMPIKQKRGCFAEGRYRETRRVYFLVVYPQLPPLHFETQSESTYSPDFEVECFGDSKCWLEIYPRGDGAPGFASCYLRARQAEVANKWSGNFTLAIRSSERHFKEGKDATLIFLIAAEDMRSSEVQVKVLYISDFSHIHVSQSVTCGMRGQRDRVSLLSLGPYSHFTKEEDESSGSIVRILRLSSWEEPSSG